MYVRMHMYMYSYMYMYVYVYIHVYIHVYMSIFCMCTYFACVHYFWMCARRGRTQTRTEYEDTEREAVSKSARKSTRKVR